jgi:sulfur carrier protein
MSSTGSYRADDHRLHGAGAAGGPDVRLTVNGAPRLAKAGTSVTALLGEVGLADKPCAVEVNRALVPKSRHGATVLHDGDVVELVTLVGGG